MPKHPWLIPVQGGFVVRSAYTGQLSNLSKAWPYMLMLGSFDRHYDPLVACVDTRRIFRSGCSNLTKDIVLHCLSNSDSLVYSTATATYYYNWQHAVHKLETQLPVYLASITRVANGRIHGITREGQSVELLYSYQGKWEVNPIEPAEFRPIDLSQFVIEGAEVVDATAKYVLAKVNVGKATQYDIYKRCPSPRYTMSQPLLVKKACNVVYEAITRSIASQSTLHRPVALTTEATA
jgi:hypothetical protein